MFGFLIGTASLIGLFKVMRGGCGYGGGHWGHGRHGHWGGHGRGPGRGGWMFRGLFQRLETTPGQEKVILEAFESLRAAGMKFKDEGDKLRKDVAAAFRAGTLDHEPLKAAFLRHDALVEELQRELLVSLGKVHEALDERQRKEAADLIENGFRHAAFGGHGYGRGYGHGGGCGGGWRSRRGGGYGEDVQYTAQA